MDPGKLAHMANQIGAYYATEPDRDKAIAGVASHLRRFWDPRMRTQFIAWVEQTGAPGLEPMVKEAVLRNRDGLLAPTPRNPPP